ncbi:MAG: DNA gyrase subunit A [Clostridia bacterium]
MQNFVKDQIIPDTLKENYVPYAMSVIVSRAIPEIDGFKPSHRKILYTMYKMGLLNGSRTKCANIVGQTMKLNPHGDAAIYETLVRLTEGSEALLTPFIDSKGNFGKIYSRDMSYAASRYTEAKLSSICREIFEEIDYDTVDFVPNYDNKMQEPVLLPTTFPNILANPNTGIAVSMASSFCSFNLVELCNTTIEYIKNPEHDILKTMPAPDFTTGGEIIVDEEQMREIYRTGRGSFRVRSKWQYVKKENIIEITEIPYTTTVEAIIDKVSDLVKSGKIKEVSDMRDETDLSGLKIAIEIKRGVDADKLMTKLFKMTPLMESFSCNFNLLINGAPKVLGVSQILDEWVSWRTISIHRKISYEVAKKREKLHLLLGLAKILVDIDKAINIIRDTEKDNDVIPNLMLGFDIDEIQADFIAEIRLRHINKEYILKRTKETDDLINEIKKLEGILESKAKILNIIIKQLESIIKKYPKERKSDIISQTNVATYKEEDHIEDYNVNIFLTKEGYFKKITPISLRMSGEQKLKDGDEMFMELALTNKSEVIFFTNMHKAYKTRLHEFDDTKSSVLGEYLPSKLDMDEDEFPVFMFAPDDYNGHIIICFVNGKVAKFDLKSFETKTNRKKLTAAYSDKSAVVEFFHIKEDVDLILESSSNRYAMFNTSMVLSKATRSNIGVMVFTLRGKNTVLSARISDEDKNEIYRVKAIPSIGTIIKKAENSQISLL